VRTVDEVLATSGRGGSKPSSFQFEWRNQAGVIEENLEEGKQKLLQALQEAESYDQQSPAKEFSQKLPPLAFQIARETRELVRRVQELKTGDEDFS
jgi:hypothetical protein